MKITFQIQVEVESEEPITFEHGQLELKKYLKNTRANDGIVLNDVHIKFPEQDPVFLI